MTARAATSGAGADALADAVVEFSARRTVPLMNESAAGPSLMTEGAGESGPDEVGPDNYRCEVVVTYEQGFHVRPCTEFAALALTFESDIHVHFGNLHVDGKAPMDLLTLAAGPGARLVLETRGPDAREALAALVGLVHSGFPEGKAAS